MSKPAAKPPTSSFAAFLNALSWSRARKDPDFDAGLNSSSAWTEALSNPDGIPRASLAQYNVNSLSDDEADEADAKLREEVDDPVLDAEQGKPARALYAFEGKPEFRELTAVQAGDRLVVLREEVGDGWSLVKHYDGLGERKPEAGLLPQSYYTVRVIHVPLGDPHFDMSASLLPSSPTRLTLSSLLRPTAYQFAEKLQAHPSHPVARPPANSKSRTSRSYHKPQASGSQASGAASSAESSSTGSRVLLRVGRRSGCYRARKTKSLYL